VSTHRDNAIKKGQNELRGFGKTDVTACVVTTESLWGTASALLESTQINSPLAGGQIDIELPHRLRRQPSFSFRPPRI
jgi:hypothetical protein